MMKYPVAQMKKTNLLLFLIGLAIAGVLHSGAMAETPVPSQPTWKFDKSNQFGLFPSVKVVKLGSGARSAPFFADLDDDKDLDLIVGQWMGNLTYFENTGNPKTPAWKKTTLFEGLNIGEGSIPALADLDNDKDLDLAIGSHSGMTYYYKNIGTSSKPAWDFSQPRYFAIDADFTKDIKKAILFREDTAPSFADLDDDGDLDLIIGEHASRESATESVHQYPEPGFSVGCLNYFENTGTAESPVWTENTKIFYDLNSHGHHALATLVDLDKDEDLDLTVSYAGTFLAYYENIGTKKMPRWEDKSELMYGAIGRLDTTRIDNERPLGKMGAWKSTLADLDADGDMDLFMGAGSGLVYGFINQ